MKVSIFKDLSITLSKKDLLITLSTEDIRQRYRRSVLGPFWITLSMGILILTLGTLYGSLFKVDLTTYIPFLAAGLVIWGFISQSLSELCLAFVESAHYIKQVKIPLVIYILRILVRNLIILFHNSIIIVATLIFFNAALVWQYLLIVPAILLLFVNLAWVGIVVAIVSSRYRDVSQIIISLLQPIFFFTPIIWTVDLVPDRTYLIDSNPFYHLIELVRAPILGQIPSNLTWMVVLTMTVLGWLFAAYFHNKYQHKVAYWVI
ncbi:MAG: ABC transporter permease [Gammaproteobacteria bacterium]|nr:ABC transporter permease [Gammaproteobacteria bacterium]